MFPPLTFLIFSLASWTSRIQLYYCFDVFFFFFANSFVNTIMMCWLIFLLDSDHILMFLLACPLLYWIPDIVSFSLLYTHNVYFLINTVQFCFEKEQFTWKQSISDLTFTFVQLNQISIYFRVIFSSFVAKPSRVLSLPHHK